MASKAPLRDNRRHGLLAWLTGVLLTAVTPAGAETVHLKDGTVLVGARQREADGKVYFKSDLLGDLVIDADAIVPAGEGAVQPAAGGGAAQPAAGGGAAQPAPGGGAAQPAPGGGAAQPAPGGGTAQPGAGDAAGKAGQNASTVPKTGWSAKLSAGGNYTSATFKQGELVPGSGVTGESLKLPGRQIGVQVSATVTYSTPKYTTSLEGKLLYLDIQPLGRQAESYLGALSLLYRLGGPYFAASRTSLFRDDVKNIDYSFLQLLGVGRLLLDRPATKLDFTPGVLLLVEGKGLETDGDPLFGVGAMENFSHAFNPFVLVEQRLLFHSALTHLDFTGVNAYVGFKGKLSRRLGVQFGVTVAYDRSLAKVPLPMAPMPIFANETSQVIGMLGLEYSR